MMYLCRVVVPACKINPLKSKALSLELYNSINSSSASVCGGAGLGKISDSWGAAKPLSLSGKLTDPVVLAPKTEEYGIGVELLANKLVPEATELVELSQGVEPSV